MVVLLIWRLNLGVRFYQFDLNKTSILGKTARRLGKGLKSKVLRCFMKKGVNWGKAGLIIICLLSMLSYTLVQRLGAAYFWPTAMLAGVLLGWFVGSRQWRCLGQDLVIALVSVVCVLFGAVLPLIAISQQEQGLLWLAVGGGSAVGLLVGTKVCGDGSRRQLADT